MAKASISIPIICFNQYGRNSEENERKTGRTEEESITGRYETTDSASVLNIYFVELN